MKKISRLGGLVLLLVGLFFASLLVGQESLSVHELGALLTGRADSITQLLFWEFRMPRTLLAIFGGAALAAAGFILQGLTGNDLADSSILGVNSGISLLILLYLGFFPQGTTYQLPLVGFLGGILAAVLVYLIAYQRQRLLSINRLLMAGIAVNAGINALTIMLTVMISKERYNFVSNFLAGSIWGATWPQLQILLPIVTILVVLAWLKIPLLNILRLGQEQAISLGLKINQTRLVFLLLAVALAAVAVSFTGSLSFVGLLAPHIGKNYFGKQNRLSFSGSLLIGGILVLVADIIGRGMLSANEIPAGIMIALIGAPYFLYLLVRKTI